MANSLLLIFFPTLQVSREDFEFFNEYVLQSVLQNFL